MKRVLIVLVVLCLAAVKAAAQPEGFVYGLEYNNIGPAGLDLWSMNLETGEFTTVGEVNPDVLGSQGSIDSWNNVYVHFTSGRSNGRYEIVGIDLLTGVERHRHELAGGVPIGTCFNPANGLFYTLLRTPHASLQLVTIDIAAGEFNYLEELDFVNVNACSAILDYARGRYHFAAENDRVYELDINNGKIVGDYSLDLLLWPGFFDPVTGKFFGVGGPDKSQLASFDPDTRQMEIISEYLDFLPRNVCVGGMDVERRLIALQFGSREFGIFDLDGNRLLTMEVPLQIERFMWTVYPSLIPGGGELARVSGQIRADQQANCIADESDDPISGWTVDVQPINRRLRTNREGRFSAYLPVGSYTFTALESELWKNACMPDGVNVKLDQSLADVDNVNIPMEAQALFESVEVSITSTPAIVGRSVLYYIRVLNTGTAAYTGRLRFKHDPILTDFTSTPEALEYNAAQAEWLVDKLAIGETRLFVVTLTVPRDETLVDLVVCGSVELPDRHSSELAGERSTDLACTEISAPRDPNDISVSPRGFGDRGIVTVEDNTLTYTIRFQNVGSAPAQDVVIRDTLDEDLNVKTIYFGAASHDYQVDIVNGNILEFRFEGINLPGRDVDEAGSHGVVKYAVDCNDDLPIDTEIFNRAAIYFDFNDPVITNTVVNSIGRSPTDIAEHSDSDELELRSLGNGLFVCRAERGLEGRLSVYSILGTKVFEQSLTGQSHTVLNLNGQPTGRYLIRLLSGGNSVVRSLVLLH